MIINPHTLDETIEGNVVQGTSRTLWEEVAFDRKNVTSVDWATYPILDITEAPEKVDVVLLNHPEHPRPRAPASRRAVRSRARDRQRDLRRHRGAAAQVRVPFSPDKVKAAFS